MTKEKRTRRNPDTYSFSLVEQSSQRVLWHRNFTRALLWLSGISVVIIGAALVYLLIALTPLRTTIPGYPDARTRNEAVQNALKIDSLETIISRWDIYAENLRRVIAGETPVNVDSVMRSRSQAAKTQADQAFLDSRDSLLRQEVAKSGRFSISDKSRSLPIEGRHFFQPVKGVVSQAYDAALHPYIDVSAPAGSLVMTVLDGTVIFAGWNDESGYSIGVQHEGDIITFYKHNQKLLKGLGDKVSAGTPIALLGSTLNPESGDHLRFELWYAGESVNPTMYINF